MRFYDFKDFEYYALIGAESVEEAVICYKDNVAYIEGEDEDKLPIEISEDEAELKLLSICRHYDEREQAKEIFSTHIAMEEPYIVLIDKDLL